MTLARRFGFGISLGLRVAGQKSGEDFVRLAASGREPIVPPIPAPALVDMALLRFFFVWWRNATVGTRVMTWLSGQSVGKDQFGNRYYQTKGGLRRWVIYNGTVEASRVPPEWHGWLHHMVKEPPTVAPPTRRAWEQEHLPNMTGTPGALRPPGSLAARATRPKATGDYEAWTPD